MVYVLVSLPLCSSAQYWLIRSFLTCHDAARVVVASGHVMAQFHSYLISVLCESVMLNSQELTYSKLPIWMPSRVTATDSILTVVWSSPSILLIAKAWNALNLWTCSLQAFHWCKIAQWKECSEFIKLVKKSGCICKRTISHAEVFDCNNAFHSVDALESKLVPEECLCTLDSVTISDKVRVVQSSCTVVFHG